MTSKSYKAKSVVLSAISQIPQKLKAVSFSHPKNFPASLKSKRKRMWSGSASFVIHNDNLRMEIWQDKELEENIKNNISVNKARQVK